MGIGAAVVGDQTAQHIQGGNGDSVRRRAKQFSSRFQDTIDDEGSVVEDATTALTNTTLADAQDD